MPLSEFFNSAGALSAFLGAGGRPVIGQALAKLPEDEEDNGIIAHFMGIPVGFQFGTAAGLTGFSALAVDILTDPITWLLPGIGGLTKAGEAGKVLSKATKLLPMADKALEAGAKTLPEVQAFWKTPLLRAAQLETISFEHTRELLTPFVEGKNAKGAGLFLEDLMTMRGDPFVPHPKDLKGLLESLQLGGLDAMTGHLDGMIGRRQNLQSLVSTALSSRDRKTVLDAIKEISKNAPTERWKHLFSSEMRGAWKAAFDEAKAGRAIQPLAATAREQAEAGQRALLSIVAPGKGRIPLIKGAGLVGSVAEGARKLGFGEQAVKAAEFLDQPLGALGASPFTLHRTISDASDIMGRGMSDALAEGNLDLSGADLLKNRTLTKRAMTDVGVQFGEAARREFNNTMQNMGLKGAKEAETVNEYMQNIGKYTKDGILNDSAKAAGITEQHAMVGDAVMSGLSKFGDMAIANHVINGVIPDYMARSVEIVAGKEAEFHAALGTYSRKAADLSTFWSHAQERKIPAWDQLMALERRGIVKVEKDPGRLLKNYITSLGKATANASFVDGMALSYIPQTISSKAGVHDVLLHLLVPGGKNDRFIARSGRYVSTSRKAEPAIVSLMDQITERTGRKGFRSVDHVWVHQDIADKLKAVIEPGFSQVGALPATATGPEKVMSGLLMANAIAKRFLLMPGTFHFVSLTEKALVTNGWEGFKSIMGRVLPNLVKPARARSYLETLPDMADAIRAGLELGPPIDAEVDMFQKALKRVSEKLPITKPVIDAVRSLDEWASGKLWGQYHAPMKLYSYHELVTRGLERFPKLDPAALKAEVALHVNASFGGGNLERLVGSKKGQQLMRLFFLAPDWNIGNLRIATDVFANLFSKERALLPQGAIVANDARAFFARQYALRTGLMMAFVGNFVNLAFTGHFMWDNEDKTRIQLPGSDEKGKPIYLGMFDPFMAPFEMAASPFQYISRKAGPVPRTVIGEVTGKDFFGGDIVTAKDGPLVNIAKRIGFALQNTAVPISAQVVTGMQYGKVPLAARLLSAAGLSVRGSKQNAGENPQAAQQAALEKAVAQFSEAHSLMMKSDAYRRGLDQAAVSPMNGIFAVPGF